MDGIPARLLPPEEQLAALREAYGIALAAQIARNRVVVAECERLQSEARAQLVANTNLLDLNNLLTQRITDQDAAMTRVVGLLLSQFEGLQARINLRDVAALDGAEVKTEEQEDGTLLYRLVV